MATRSSALPASVSPAGRRTANHRQRRVALAKLKATGIANTPNSVYRDRRVRGALAPTRGRLTMDDLCAAFFDDWQSPWSVCPRLG